VASSLQAFRPTWELHTPSHRPFIITNREARHYAVLSRLLLLSLS
jgi:hypothetical protein